MISSAILKRLGKHKAQYKIDAFNDLISGVNLIGMEFCNQLFTWSNKQGDDNRVRERLDRGLVNHLWLLKYPNARVYHKSALGSDHCPLFVTTTP